MERKKEEGGGERVGKAFHFFRYNRIDIKKSHRKKKKKKKKEKRGKKEKRK